MYPRRPLTDREVEVMHYIGIGKTNLEVGEILGIARATVSNHIRSVYWKLDVTNRVEAVRKVDALNKTTVI